MRLVRDFNACADCPQCGRFDYHRLSEPWPPPIEPKRLVATVTDWEGNLLSEYYSAPGGVLEAYELNTDMCDVVRTCSHCGCRWGEK